MKRAQYLAVAAAALTLTAAAQARFVSQVVQGTDRLCIYEKDGPISAERQVLKVGLAEPCPPFMPYVEEARGEEPIPFMAQLRTMRTRDERRICVYAYAGRDYEKAINISLSCPINPSF